MQKVITINLNGTAYQLDEDAFDALQRYLDGARSRLKDNPDLAEIMADLEQAIGEKCRKFLGPHKTVVSATEVGRVLEEMGPVDAADAAQGAAGREAADGSSGGAARDADAPKRLYQIREGAMLSGVCQGLAAYLHVDVTLVRLVFVILAIVTKGGFGLVYLVLMFVIPPASTSEEHAAAHGAPFNAQEIVDQAKSTARDVVDQARKTSAAFSAADWRQPDDWKQHWRREKREWRRNWFRERREWKRQWRQSRRAWWGPYSAASAGYATRVSVGFLAPALGLASAAVFWVWAAAMMSLLGTGSIFGQPLPADLPLWAGCLILVLLYNMVLWPLQHARTASYQVLGGRSDQWGSMAAWDGMMGFGFWILLGWAAYRYIPEVHQFMNNLPAVRDNIRQIFQAR